MGKAASEGARAAVVGLSTEERRALAMAAATATLSRYGAFVGQALTPVRTATETVDGAQRLAVTVSVDLSPLGLDRIAAFVPVPAAQASVTVSVQVGGFSGP